MIQSWENLVMDKRTHGQTEGQTEYWFHRTLSEKRYFIMLVVKLDAYLFLRINNTYLP